MARKTQLDSPLASVFLGQWAGLQIALVSPKQPSNLQDLLLSIQHAHKPDAALGFVAISQQEEIPSISGTDTLYRLNTIAPQESFLLERLTAELPYLPNTETPISGELMTLVGVPIPDGLLPQSNLARRFGHVVGSLLKHPKQLLQFSSQQLKRLEAQKNFAEHLEKAIYKARSNDD